MNNTEIWDKLKRVDKDALKGFTRAGGFKGTAIRPMWSIHKMTEVYGPVGKGWGYQQPHFEVVHAGEELMVYCTVAAWAETPQNMFYGVGGDKIITKNNDGKLKNDDEAFKKAFTDALTNALKHLGAGADVHMGLWDGNKYIDEAAEEKPPMAQINGTQGASKAPAREDYTRLQNDLRKTKTMADLEAWFRDNAVEIDALPSDWIDPLRQEYVDRKHEFKLRSVA